MWVPKIARALGSAMKDVDKGCTTLTMQKVTDIYVTILYYYISSVGRMCGCWHL